VRPSVDDDIESQSARPVPKVVNVPELVVVAIALIVTALLVWFGT
jgi:hypothetical protein